MAQVKPLSTQDVNPREKQEVKSEDVGSLDDVIQPPLPETQPQEQLDDKKPITEQSTKG